MYSGLFGLDPTDDLDSIFNLDDLDAPTIHNSNSNGSLRNTETEDPKAIYDADNSRNFEDVADADGPKKQSNIQDRLNSALKTSNLPGSNDIGDLDSIYNLDDLDAPPAHNSSYILTNRMNSLRNSKTSETISTFSNNCYSQHFKDVVDGRQIEPKTNVRADSGFEITSQISNETSISTNSFVPLSNLSFHSLLRRNEITEIPDRQNSSIRPSIINQENCYPFVLQTQDELVFSPFFGNDTASGRHNAQNDVSLTPQRLLTGSIEDTTLSRHRFEEHHNDVQSQMNSYQTNEKRSYHHNFDLNSQRVNRGESQFVFSNNNTQANGEQQHVIFNQQSTQPGQSQGSYIFSPLFGSSQPTSNIIGTVPALPTSILNLYKLIKSYGLSDWSFVHVLSAQTCQELMPTSCNVTLKKSLLLSIASINTEDDRIPIPIIAIGQVSSPASSIMNYIGNFAQRFLAPTDHLFNISIRSDKLVEIGPVFLAKNGVCFLGDWSALKKNISEEIKIIIDSGRLFLNQTSENFQLSSAIWTYWSSTQKIKSDYANVAIFIKYFGIPIVIDSDDSDMVDFLLNEAKSGEINIPNDHLNICYDDMKTFLNLIRKIKVEKSDESRKLLQLYSETIKNEREGALSVRGFQVIEQMAESFARLSMRNTVEICDVEAAISIAENTFHEVLIRGISGLPPAPLLGCAQNIQEVDEYLKKFHNWIDDYVSKQ